MPPKKAAAAKAVPAAKAAQPKSARATRAPKAKTPTETATTAKSSGTKRKASEVSADEPETKKTKTKSAIKPATKKADAGKPSVTKTVPSKKPAAPKPAAKPAPQKTATVKKAATEEPVPKKPAAPKKVAAPKAASGKKALPAVNNVPTQKLDVYVFGEGSAGELGLGASKYDGNKKPIDVMRPRLNHRLSAKEVGVVQIAVGGMHCAALTHDGRILTWGVNDQGALGRETDEGKMKEINAKESEDSDSDDDDDDNLNPSEAEPRDVDPKYFLPGTKFSQLAASDSATFAVTTDGSVYGWGTFRGNDGILGFRQGIKSQRFPTLIPELKKIVALSAGTNHVLALTDKGKVFAWGAGEQNQLARRVVSRTAAGALIPREFGLQRKTITKIGCGDYHSFAVDKNGKVYSWGLNTFGQTGIAKDEDDENNTITTPTLVENLKGFAIKQICGGAHHTLSCTESGEVLVWGRIDNAQGGMEISKFSKEDLYFDEHNKPRFLTKPVILPSIKGECVSAATDTCLVVTKDGKAYSWGFSGNYQTGLGTTEDVKEATLVENTAVKGKKLVFAGAGDSLVSLQERPRMFR